MKINELIKELCPNGVEWKTLGEVCQEIIVPMRDRPKIFDGTIPWCRIEDIEGQYFNKSLSGLGVSESIIKEMNLKVFPTGTVICSCSASIGVYAINTQPLITNQTFIGLVCGENLYNKFLLYFMETQTNTIKGLATIGTIPYVSRQKFESHQIPIPPLAIQTRIVEILDHFTNLTANLTAELNLRRKQFEHYREKLLSLDGVEGVEWKKLGEVISDLRTGLNPRIHFKLNTDDAQNYYITVRELKGFDFEVDEKTDRINNSAVLRINERSKLKIGDILFSGTGTIGRTALIKRLPTNYNIKEGVYAITPKTNIIDSKFLIYLLHTDLIMNVINSKSGGSTVRSIPMAELKNILLPIPSLKIQHSIVSILDKFTALIENIEKELALRQKQYEYYREQLLTFKS